MILYIEAVKYKLKVGLMGLPGKQLFAIFVEGEIGLEETLVLWEKSELELLLLDWLLASISLKMEKNVDLFAYIWLIDYQHWRNLD